MIAEVLVFAGKVIVKVEVVTLSLPKSSTATERLALELLYINAPRTVKLAEVHDILSKLIYATPLAELTTGFKSVCPVAVYPAPEISPVAVYAIVS
jgi:hypothetical protein